MLLGVFWKAQGAKIVLCNNGAIAFTNSHPTPFAQQAAPTFAINYFGTVSLTLKLLPLLRLASEPQPQIVNIASMAGHLRILKGKPVLVKQLTEGEGLSIPDIEALVAAPLPLFKPCSKASMDANTACLQRATG